MGTDRIDIIINGKNNLSSALRSASNDIKNLGNDADGASKKINQSFKNVDTDITKLHRNIKGLSGAFSGLAGVMGGVFSGYALYDMVKAAVDSNREWRRFFGNQNIDFATQKGLITSQKKEISDLANQYGVYTGQVRDSMNSFIQRGNDYNQSLHGTKAALALAAGTGMDVAEAGEMIANATASDRGIKALMRKTGLSKEQLTNEQGKFDILKAETALNEKYAKTLEEQGRSDEANLVRAENSWNKIKVTIGSLLSGPLAFVAEKLQWIADIFNNLDPTLKSWVGWAIALGVVLVGVLGTVAALRKTLDLATGKPKKVKIDCDQDDDCNVKVKCKGDGDGSSYGGGKNRGGFWASGPGQFLSGMSLIPALTGPGGATWAGLGLLSQLGTVAGAGIAGAATGYGLNYMDWMNRGNTMYQGSRIASPSTYMLAPFQGAMGFWGDVIGGKNPLESFQNQMGINQFLPKNLFGGIKWPSSGELLNGIKEGLLHGVKTPKFPGVPDILNLIKPKIPNMHWKIPSIGDIMNGIRTKIPQIGWHIPGAGSILGTISSKIFSLHWQIPSVGSILDIIRSKIMPTGPWGPPPGTIASIRSAANTAHNVIKKAVPWLPFGPGPVYESYAGHRKSGADALLSGGNCFDLTCGMLQAAGAGEMVWGHWDGTPHVWARIGGVDYDPARKALHNTWSPPPQGPGSGGGAIVIMGDVYGFDDFARKVEKANNRIMRF